MFSKVLRRTHMYVALFLAPWVLMYTASTFVMNHRRLFHGEEPAPPRWVKQSESTYNGDFAPSATPRDKARQILASLDLDGAFQVNRREGALVIQRMDAVEPRRVTFREENKSMLIEKLPFEAVPFLERMHRRRGFQQPYWVDGVWGFSVDMFIAAVMFWALSGLWLWWEMKVTRALGFLAIAAGAGLFALFVEVL